MAYASRSGRARTSPSSPQAFGVCDRCGIWYNRIDLRNQHDWRGASILPLNIYVCNQCYDVPQEQNRAIVPPADPVPIANPRVEWFLQDETSQMTLTTGRAVDPITGVPIPSETTLATAGGVNMAPTPYGEPVGLNIDAVQPLAITGGVPTLYGLPLPVLSVIATATDQIAVTCSAPHGLSTNNQIAVEGLANVLANGFYSVAVTTATAFTYQTYARVPAGSLLTSQTRMITATTGLPRDFSQLVPLP